MRWDRLRWFGHVERKSGDDWYQCGGSGVRCAGKSLLFDTPQVFDFLKVDSDAALLPS